MPYAIRLQAAPMDEAGAGRPMESILAAYPAHPVLDLIMREHPPRHRTGWRPIWGHGPGVHRRSYRAVQALDGSFDVFSTVAPPWGSLSG